MEDYVAYKRTSEQWNMKHYHFHEEYEILLSLSENAEMFITDRKYPLRYGSLILLPSAVLHRSVGLREPHYDRYVIRFYSRYAQSLSTPSRVWRAPMALVCRWLRQHGLGRHWNWIN